jgi:hypothetical protein
VTAHPVAIAAAVVNTMINGVLFAPVPADDPTTAPAPPYQIQTSDGPQLPGNQKIPPICEVYMRACGFHFDPDTQTWQR